MIAQGLKWIWRAMGFHVHDWTKWNTRGEIIHSSHGGTIGESQVRRCEKCGMTQTRQIWL